MILGIFKLGDKFISTDIIKIQVDLITFLKGKVNYQNANFKWFKIATMYCYMISFRLRNVYYWILHCKLSSNLFLPISRKNQNLHFLVALILLLNSISLMSTFIACHYSLCTVKRSYWKKEKNRKKKVFFLKITPLVCELFAKHPYKKP